MTKHENIFGAERHDRLFELIRQNNLGRASDEHTPEAMDLAQMQRFLKRANRSFDIDSDSDKQG